jgi:hypothetical protein
MRRLLSILAFWFVVSGSLTFAADVVTIEWAWMPAVSGPTPELYLPYVCQGRCGSSGPWLPETDTSGTRVRFDAPVCVPIAGDVICRGRYESTWPVGETWSLALTGAMLDGRESVLSNIVVKTREALPTTTTTLPPVPLMPPGLVDVTILP